MSQRGLENLPRRLWWRAGNRDQRLESGQNIWEFKERNIQLFIRPHKFSLKAVNYETERTEWSMLSEQRNYIHLTWNCLESLGLSTYVISNQGLKSYRGQRRSWPFCSQILQRMTKWKWKLIAQPCPTLCDPMDCSLSGSSVHGLHQARILEWVVIPFFRDQTRVPSIAGRFFFFFLQADSSWPEPPGKPNGGNVIVEWDHFEGGNRTGSILKAGLHLGTDCRLWAICPVSMETTYQLENQAPWMEEPQGSYLDSVLPKRIP